MTRETRAQREARWAAEREADRVAVKQAALAKLTEEERKLLGL